MNKHSPSFYLTEEAEKARVNRLITRLVNEHEYVGDFRPQSDYWKLPLSIRDRIRRRIRENGRNC